ncbi:MAG: hypothetical protein WAM44_10835 [Chthoniobacterales bacterium]
MLDAHITRKKPDLGYVGFPGADRPIYDVTQFRMIQGTHMGLNRL